MTYNLEKFLKGLEELQIELSDNQVKQFIRYYEMLVEKNKSYESELQSQNLMKSLKNIFWTVSP